MPKATPPPRAQALQYGSPISLLARLPEVLLPEDMFRERDIVVADANVVVGTVHNSCRSLNAEICTGSKQYSRFLKRLE